MSGSIREILMPAFTKLITAEPYYAHFILNMDVEVGPTWRATPIPTAAVTYERGRFKLLINPEWYTRLSDDEQAAVLKHECLHVLDNHLGRTKMDMLANLAADVTINQFINSLPEGCVTLEAMQKEVPDLRANETLEYYEVMIKNEAAKKQGEGGGVGRGMSTLDSHEVWKHADATPEELKHAAKVLGERVKQAAGAGNTPGEVEALLQKLGEARHNWRAELRRFVASQAASHRKTSRKRRNRRFAYKQPGWRRDQKLKLAVAIDTSGSVGDAELQMFLDEIGGIYRVGEPEIFLIPCDTRVGEVTEYKHNQREFKMQGRGGTLFQPALDAANELAVDGLIYLTDGGCYDNPKQPAYPVLWALLPKCSADHIGWGQSTVLERAL